MLKHVLVPLDGSRLAERAFSYAQDILAPKGKLTLLNVIDEPIDYSYSPLDTPLTTFTMKPYNETEYKNNYARAREYLYGIAEKFQEKAYDVQVMVLPREHPIIVRDNYIGSGGDIAAHYGHSKLRGHMRDAIDKLGDIFHLHFGREYERKQGILGNATHGIYIAQVYGQCFPAQFFPGNEAEVEVNTLKRVSVVANWMRLPPCQAAASSPIPSSSSRQGLRPGS